MVSEQELRQHRCCFTGHRTEKLTRPEDVIRKDLERAIRLAISGDYTTFITGMAEGVDIMAGEIVLEMKKEISGLKLIAVVPFEGFEEGWEAHWLKRYYTLRARADLVRVMCPEYRPEAYEKRNRWMVDHSGRVIAVYGGKPGGTKNTIDYALLQGIPVELISA